MYEAREGQLRFIGVEYLVPADAWNARHPEPPAADGPVVPLTRERIPGLERPGYAQQSPLHNNPDGCTKTPSGGNGSLPDDALPALGISRPEIQTGRVVVLLLDAPHARPSRARHRPRPRPSDVSPLHRHQNQHERRSV